MKILTGRDIREADRYTMEHEPISSLDLMERASRSIARWMEQNIGREIPLLFVVGKGNNGGDGLAVARMLSEVGYRCAVCGVYAPEQMTPECRTNWERLPEDVERCTIDSLPLTENTVVVDALLGTGVRGEVKDPVKGVILAINASNNRVVSIDMPSGMGTEFDNAGRTMVHAWVTLTLEIPKLALLLPEAGDAAGRFVVLPIGLDQQYMAKTPSSYFYTGREEARQLIVPRHRFAHKGTHGHALLICGSRGMVGAAVMATRAALRSGCGLVTTHQPESERMVVQVACPSAMVSCDPESVFSCVPKHLERYRAIGVGCGVGQDPRSVLAFRDLLAAVTTDVKLVIDADALNMLAAHPECMDLVPAEAILTPHLGELKRLVGPWSGEEEKIERVRSLAARLQAYIVVKGANTMICTPDGRCLFNATGNPGMAKGGSGDVLTGYITGLLARGYDPCRAAVLGVYLHGMAGDRAAEKYGEEGMNASDIIDFLGTAQTETMNASE